MVGRWVCASAGRGVAGGSEVFSQGELHASGV